MAVYILDTNTVQCLLQKTEPEHFRVKDRLQEVLSQNALIIISPVVFYEAARLLYHKKAWKQLDALKRLASLFDWRDLDRAAWDLAAQLWARCRHRGRPTGRGRCRHRGRPTGRGVDADVLIAAQAKLLEAIVVTNNVRHFDYLGIRHQTW